MVFFFFGFATNDTLCLRGFCIVSWYSYGRIVEIIRLLFLYCPLVRSGGNFVWRLGYGTYLFNLPMFYLLFGNDACLLRSVFGFSFHASFYGMFERLDMILDLILLPLLWMLVFTRWFLTLSLLVLHLVLTRPSWGVSWTLILGRVCGLSCLPVSRLVWFLG